MVDPQPSRRPNKAPQIEPRLRRRGESPAEHETPQRAALYTRVSTDMQVEAESLGTQEKQLREYCRYQQVAIHHVYTDAGISGAHTENRPAFQQMMKDAREGKFNVVIVAKIDRISRNLSDLLDLIHTLEAHNVDFISISQQFDTSTPMGRLTLNILGSFAQFERDIIAERTRENMIERARNGKWNGGVVPYGFMVVEDRLEPEASEAEFVRMMYHEYLKQRSLRAVAIMLNARNAKPRYAHSFTGSSVKRILSNPVYRGASCYNKRRIDGTTSRARPKSEWILAEDALPRIVSPETWEEVNRLLSADDGIRPGARSSTYLLAGLLRCGNCGMHMQGRRRTRFGTHTRKKRTHFYYVCYTNAQKGSAACNHTSVPARQLESRIIDALSRLATNPDPIFRQAEKILASSAHNRQRLMEDHEAASGRLTEIENRLKRLADGFEEGLLEKAEYARRARALRSERDILRQQQESTGAKLKAIRQGGVDPHALSGHFDIFQDAFPQLPIQEQKQVLQDLIDHVVVHPSGDLDVFIYQPVIKAVFDGADASDGVAPGNPVIKITITPSEQSKPPLKPLSEFETVAQRLTYLREREGITKSQLARELGVHACSVANWELREIPPKKPVGRKLAEYFKVPYAELFDIPPVDESLPPWERLKPLREYLGYTMGEFARILGLTLDGYNLREYRPERVRIVTEEMYGKIKSKVSVYR